MFGSFWRLEQKVCICECSSLSICLVFSLSGNRSVCVCVCDFVCHSAIVCVSKLSKSCMDAMAYENGRVCHEADLEIVLTVFCFLNFLACLICLLACLLCLLAC